MKTKKILLLIFMFAYYFASGQYKSIFGDSITQWNIIYGPNIEPPDCFCQTIYIKILADYVMIDSMLYKQYI